MSYVGNTPTQQAFSPAVDYFSGNGSTVAFTLSRPVASVAQVQVVVNNVDQNPSTAFTVSGQTLTFTGAPSSGTNNIYVYYTSPITQVIQPGQGTVNTTQLVDASVTSAKLASGSARANFGAGAVLQVVNATYSTQVNNTTNTFVDTGLSASITPTSSTSKILVIVNQTGCSKPNLDTSINLKLFRNATEILLFGRFVSGNAALQDNITSVGASYLDSPVTTASVTYKTQFNNDTPYGTCSVQKGSTTYPSSTITLMEIAG